MILGRHWRHSLYRIVLLYALIVVPGAVAGHFWAALAIASSVVAAWTLVRLAHITDRLRGQRRFGPPEGYSAWSELEWLLYQRQKESRNRKRRLLSMLRAYREAAAALPDAIIVLDRAHLRIRWFNEAARRLVDLNYPRDIGAVFTHCLRTPRVVEWLRRGQAGEPLMDMPSPLDDKVRLSYRLIPYFDDQWLLVIRDVTKLMHLEQVRRDFVANVSHELRTPLTVVHGYLDLLEPEEKPDWAPMLGEMRHQSQRMTQIVEDLLTLSRLEAQERLAEEPVNMASMLSTLRREADALSQGRHRIGISDEAGRDLRGSTKELHSAFSNLVTNAVRYTPDGGRITIALRSTSDGGVTLAVTDTGQGIPAQHLDRITERFYRVSTSRSRDSGGTGLGLSIVKHVLALHQARLEIESEMGLGSTFRVVFGPERVLERNDHEDAFA